VDKAHGGSGNPAPFTAYGVLQGIKSAVEFKMKRDSLSGLTFALQGLGNVGLELAKLLKTEGSKVIATDVDQEKLNKAKSESIIHDFVKPDEIYGVSCDVFTPCAMGAILNEATIPQLKCKIVAGAANNQLKELTQDGTRLIERDILYVPDYVINAGGLINVYVELEGYSRERAMRFCRTIYTNCKSVFEISVREKIPTFLASERLVEHRIEAMTKLAPQFNVYPRESFDKRR
jgi:leucine dehydrogenase